MPAMPRPNNKATKVIYKLFGVPANLEGKLIHYQGSYVTQTSSNVAARGYNGNGTYGLGGWHGARKG